MNVALIGAGAVGLGLASCIAGRLSGPLCLVVRRREVADTIGERGIRRTGIFGVRNAAPSDLQVFTRIADLTGAPPDFVLVCTKSGDSRTIADELADAWPTLDNPAVVLCHNGWGSAEVFASRLPRERIFNARVITGFRKQAEDAVDITVHAQPIHMGSLFGASPSELAPLCRAIEAGGIPCAAVDAIDRDLWAKVLYNCLLNPLGALSGVRYGVLGARAETRAIMDAVAREVFAVIEAAGYETHWSSADEYLEIFHRELLPPTAEHESSMLQDLRAGRATEIDALCGAVVALARESGVAVPVNAALLELVRAAEARARAR